MDLDGWFAQLRGQAQAANAAGVPDEQLAYAIMAVRSNQPLADEVAGHEELIYSLAWLLNVRAPGLDLDWLLKAVLDMDKVYWGALPLDTVLDRIARLERRVLEDHGDPEAWLTGSDEHPAIDAIRSAAAGLEEIQRASGDELAERVRADLAQVQRCTDEGDLLALVARPLRGH